MKNSPVVEVYHETYRKNTVLEGYWVQYAVLRGAPSFRYTVVDHSVLPRS